MSGVGEVLAIVSCVAGLIQAYDAGTRVVQQMKRRRQAHGALPPSDLLEESIDKGRKEIQQVVEDGKKRFGPSFEEGDTIAQLALFKITIETQKALLEGLTEARDDDGIIDFEDCINASDQGRSKALLELHALFSRRLEDEMEKRKKAPPPEPIPVQRPSTSPSAQTALRDVNQPSLPVPRASTEPSSLAALRAATELSLQTQSSIPTQSPPSTPSTPSAQVPQSPSSPTATQSVKRSRTFGGGLFGRKSSVSQVAKEPKVDAGRPISRPVAAKSAMTEGPGPSTRLSTFVGPEVALLTSRPKPINRRNTNSSVKSDCTKSSNEQRSSVSDTSSIKSPISPSTTSSSIVPLSQQSTAVSLTPTLAPIKNYNGCCKYAVNLRDGQAYKGLTLTDLVTENNDMLYECSSTKCRFQAPGFKHPKKGFQVSEKVFQACGVRFRWIFLAKSHVPNPEGSSEEQQPFCCLICIMLGDNSNVYNGRQSLFSHIVGHQGGYLGKIQLEGALKFGSKGASTDDDGFDLIFPERPAPAPPNPPAEKGVALVLATSVRNTKDGTILSKSDSFISYESEYDNPWVN